jgi:hypothetical protein
MSKSLEKSKVAPARPTPAALRQNLRDQVDALPDEGILVLYDLALDLQLRSAWSKSSEGMTADLETGKYEQLDEALKDGRAALRRQNST